MDEKLELRSKIKQSLVSCPEKDRQITAILLDFIEKTAPDIEHILAYYPSFPGEIDLRELLKVLFTSGINLYLPRCEKNKMDFYQLVNQNWEQELASSKYGIKEPVTSEERRYCYSENTLALVPGLAFDMSGNRLGRGLGHYDRFLENVNCLTVGLCYENQIVDLVPVEKHDQQMKFIITEKQIKQTL